MQTASAILFSIPGAVAQGVGATEIPPGEGEAFFLNADPVLDIGHEQASLLLPRRQEDMARDAAFLLLFPTATVVPAPEPRAPTVDGDCPEQIVGPKSDTAPAQIAIEPYDGPGVAKAPDVPTGATEFPQQVAPAIVQSSQLRPTLPLEGLAEPSPVNEAPELTARPVANDPLPAMPHSVHRALSDRQDADASSRVEPTNFDHLEKTVDIKIPGDPSRLPEMAAVSSPFAQAETLAKGDVAGNTTAAAGPVWSGYSIPVETPNHSVQVPPQAGVKIRPERYQSSTERLWVAQGLMPQITAALPSDQITPIQSTQARIKSGPVDVTPNADPVPEGLGLEPALTPVFADRKRDEPDLRPTAQMQMSAPHQTKIDPNAFATRADSPTEVVQGPDFASRPVSAASQTLAVGNALPDPQPLFRILVTHVAGHAVVSAEPLAPTLVAHVKSAPTGHVTLTLAPEELGRLHMTISQDAGDVRVMVSADRPETLDLMRRHADQLMSELRGAGFSGATLQFSQGGSGGFARSQPQVPFFEAPLASDPEPASARAESAERPIIINSAGLDLRI